MSVTLLMLSPSQSLPVLVQRSTNQAQSISDATNMADVAGSPVMHQNPVPDTQLTVLTTGEDLHPALIKAVNIIACLSFRKLKYLK